MKKKFSEKSILSKSIQPLLIVVVLILFAYIAYKVYLAVENGMKYDPCFCAPRARADFRAMREGLEKKGFTVKEGQAHVKVKGDHTHYLENTQRYLVTLRGSP
jgi:hypothetical protein